LIFAVMWAVNWLTMTQTRVNTVTVVIFLQSVFLTDRNSELCRKTS